MSRSKDSPYHHGNLRSALIKAGIAAIRDDGIEALSLRRLAATVGVSHNAPYMHFEDKESLLAAIAFEGFVRLSETIKAALANPSASWYERLESGCVAYVTFMLENPAYTQAMFRRYDPAHYPALSQVAGKTLGLLENLIREGQARGLVASGDSMQWTTLTWALLQGITNTLGAGKGFPPVMGRNPTDDVTRSFIRAVYEGLRPRETP